MFHLFGEKRKITTLLPFPCSGSSRLGLFLLPWEERRKNNPGLEVSLLWKKRRKTDPLANHHVQKLEKMGQQGEADQFSSELLQVQWSAVTELKLLDQIWVRDSFEEPGGNRGMLRLLRQRLYE